MKKNFRWGIKINFETEKFLMNIKMMIVSKKVRLIAQLCIAKVVEGYG